MNSLVNQKNCLEEYNKLQGCIKQYEAKMKPKDPNKAFETCREQFYNLGVCVTK
ncbi:hypothetical protein pb186bvf_011595 [Paramecium bursaria]